MKSRMKIKLTPTRDTDNSEPTEASSGVEFTSEIVRTPSDEARATSLSFKLPDGRSFTFDADEFERMLGALGFSSY